MTSRSGPGVVAVALALAGAAACGSASAPRHHQVEIVGALFQPDTVVVAVGDTVTWVNRGIVPHTVTAADGTWDSGAVAPGEAFVLAVERAEAVRYVCQYHPTMAGALTVGK